jgi:hypothetical protein
MTTTYSINLGNLKAVITERLEDDLSRVCYSEVNDTVIDELYNAIVNKDSIYGVLNDNLSNCAVDELEDADAVDYFNNISNCYLDRN